MTKDKFGMVGKTLQDFSLPTSRNQIFNTKAYQGKKNLVIVLLRDIN